jgi:hypothetical protein
VTDVYGGGVADVLGPGALEEDEALVGVAGVVVESAFI